MQNTPKQARLLGAKVCGLGVVVAVSSPLCYAIHESQDRVSPETRFTRFFRPPKNSR